MRVLFVNEDIGGHRTTHLGLRAFLPDHDVEATFVNLPPPDTARRIGSAPIPGLAHLDLDLQPLRAQLLGSLEVKRAWKRRIDEVDVVHVYTQTMALLAADLVRSKPTVVATDASGLQSARLLPYRRPGRGTELQRQQRDRLERRVWEAATVAVTKTEWAAASLRDDYGIAPERLRIVRYGVVIPEGRPQRPTATAGRLPTVAFIGRTLDRKGGRQLLRVFRRGLRGRCRLIVVTTDAIESEPDIEVVRDLNPGDTALDDVLTTADILAFPSEIDTFGYAMLEAMARGVPIVAAQANSAAEIVEDGVTGILVPVGDDAALEAALLALIDDEPRRRALGDAGRRRVEERFDARATTADLVDVLHEAIERWRP